MASMLTGKQKENKLTEKWSSEAVWEDGSGKKMIKEKTQ